MRKIAEPGTNCKRISKWCFSNFTVSPLTEKKVAMDILRIKYIFKPYNLVRFYPLKGDHSFSYYKFAYQNIDGDLFLSISSETNMVLF